MKIPTPNLRVETNPYVCQGTQDPRYATLLQDPMKCIYKRKNDCHDNDKASIDCIKSGAECTLEYSVNTLMTGNSIVSKLPDIKNLDGKVWDEERKGPGGPLGNQYFYDLPFSCKTTKGEEVPRSIFVNTIPEGGFGMAKMADSLSAVGVDGIGKDFQNNKAFQIFSKNSRGMIPGIVEQLTAFNPLYLVQDITNFSDDKNKCEEISLWTLHMGGSTGDDIQRCCTKRYMTTGDIESYGLDRTGMNADLRCDLISSSDIDGNKVSNTYDDGELKSNTCFCQKLKTKEGFQNFEDYQNNDGSLSSLANYLTKGYYIAILFVLYFIFLKIKFR